MPLHYILFVPFVMAFGPSNYIVRDKLAVLREERTAAYAEFKRTVELAKYDWEAELLLDLEEFRDAGGFIPIQKEIQRLSQFGRGHPLFGIPRNLDEMPTATVTTITTITTIDRGKPPYSLTNWKQNILDIFLADVLDIRSALSYAQENRIIYIDGQHTLLTERALFRFQFLVSVNNELRTKNLK